MTVMIIHRLFFTVQVGKYAESIVNLQIPAIGDWEVVHQQVITPVLPTYAGLIVVFLTLGAEFAVGTVTATPYPAARTGLLKVLTPK